MGGGGIGRVDIDAQLRLAAGQAAAIQKEIDKQFGRGIKVNVTPDFSKAEKALKQTIPQGFNVGIKTTGEDELTGLGGRIQSFTGLVDKADGALKKFGLTSRDLSVVLGAGLAGGVAFAIRSILQFAASTVKAAADLGEAQNLINVTFGPEISGRIEGFARGAAEAIGLSETAALKAVGSFGALAKAVGFNASTAAEFGIEFTKLASDIASLQNIDDISQVLTALQSALKGTSFEPISSLNISLNQTGLEAAAAREGIAEFGTELSGAQKFAAVYKEVLRQTEDAQGDFGRTVDSLPNQLRVFQAQVENLQAALGQGLLPIVAGAVEGLNNLLRPLLLLERGFSDLAESAEASMSSTSAGIQEALDKFFSGGGATLQKFGDSLKRFTDEELQNLADSGDKVGGTLAALAQAELEARGATDGLAGSTGALSSSLASAAISALSAAESFKIIEETAKNATQAFNKANQEAQSSFQSLVPNFGDTFREQADKQAGGANKAADALDRYGRALEDAELRIDDAERNLTRTFADTADDIADAQEAVTKAQEDGLRRIADAQEKVQDVQRDILRGEEDLAERARDAIEAVAEAERDLADVREDAARQVEDAEERLNRLLSRRRETVRQRRLREIQEARDDLEEAKEDAAESISDAQKRIVDAQRRQAEIERDIVEFREDSARKLVRAQQDVVDAQREAVEKVAEANERLAETEERAAERVEDAQRRLADAHRESERSISDALQSMERAASGAGGKTKLTLDKLAESLRTNADDLNSFTNGLLQIQEKLSTFAISVDETADKEIKQAFLARLAELAKESPELIGEVADLTVDELKARFTGPFAEQFKTAKKLADLQLDKYPENLRLKILTAAKSGAEGLQPLLDAFDALPKKTGEEADKIRAQMIGMAKFIYDTGKDIPGFLDPIRLGFIQSITDPASTSGEVVRATRGLLEDLGRVRARPEVRLAGAEEAITDMQRVNKELEKAVGFIADISGAGEGVSQQVGGLQHGGPAFGGRPYIVGERGPELFVPRHNGTVISNEDLLNALRSLADSSGGTQVFNVYPPTSDPEFLVRAVSARMGRKVRR